MFQTKEINGLHYIYYPEDLGNLGITAFCDETGEEVILEMDESQKYFTGNIIPA